MCLENRKTGRAKEAAIAALPETFFVWKFCPRGRWRPEFHYKWERAGNDFVKEPTLEEDKWHEAQRFPSGRSILDYKPGFHAFLDYDEAEDYYSDGLQLAEKVLFKFEARRQDVKEIGNFDGRYYFLKGVVLQFIKPVIEQPSETKGEKICP